MVTVVVRGKTMTTRGAIGHEVDMYSRSCRPFKNEGNRLLSRPHQEDMDGHEIDEDWPSGGHSKRVFAAAREPLHLT